MSVVVQARGFVAARIEQRTRCLAGMAPMGAARLQLAHLAARAALWWLQRSHCQSCCGGGCGGGCDSGRGWADSQKHCNKSMLHELWKDSTVLLRLRQWLRDHHKFCKLEYGTGT